jgi:hypothetical protein
MATFEQSRIWAMNRLKDIFHDEDGNLERWLNGERCVFRPIQKAEFMEIRIGNDVEALYYFLCFCDKLNTHQRISEDFRDYLSLLITRSCSEYWEEC